MKNLVNHDSIHRVEPSARALAEQLQKLESDRNSEVHSQQREMDQKAEQVNDLHNAELNADGGRKKKDSRFGSRARSGSGKKDPGAKGHFFGGQLFDEEG